MISEKILVIDDDLRFIKELTKKFVEYEFIYFTTGEEALEFLKKPIEINLVLLDYRLPGMNGLSVLEEIRKKNKDIAVILMTAYVSLELAMQAITCRVDGLMEKPVKAKDLREKMQELLYERMCLFQGLSDDDQMARIERYIDRSPEDANINNIAELLCRDQQYIAKLFKRNGRCGFRDYRKKAIIQKAQVLLKDPTLTVTMIAYELGYQNPETFMRLFRRETQRTPTGYRRTLKPFERKKIIRR